MARRPGGGGRGGGPLVVDRWESVVGALQMGEALVAGGLARLEAQAREPVAADELVAPARGRHEHEAACRGRVAGRVAGTNLVGGDRCGGHGKHDRAAGVRLRWPDVQETARPTPPAWNRVPPAARGALTARG